MTGYSRTPLPEKLGIKEGHAVFFPGAPEGFAARLSLPATVSVRRAVRGPLDVIVFFTDRRAELERRLPALKAALAPDGGLWVAWPKKAAGVSTDLSFEVVQPIGLAVGLVDNKVCAIDEVWSGLRFVYRRRDRPGAKGK